MKKLLLLSLLFLISCTTPVDVSKEQVIQDANVDIAKEKTKQMQYQWKIDSLKASQKK